MKKRIGVIAVVSMFLLPSASRSEERHLPAPLLSKSVRKVIRARMAHHGQEMSKLMWAVVFLDYSGVEQAASRIPNPALLQKDLQRDATDLNFTFPDRFFDLLMELTERSTKVAEAAAKHDGPRMGAAYGQVSETCVNCHSVYLDETAWKR